MTTKIQAASALQTLRGFIGDPQLRFIGSACRGEEKEWFFDKLCEYAERVKAMPATYDQEGKGDGAIVHLHYFAASADWWITEKDSDPDGEGQVQAFGLACLGDAWDAELGYIDVKGLTSLGAELDLHWTPKTLAEVKKGLEGRHGGYEKTV